MKLIIDGTSEEIKNVLQAMDDSKEHELEQKIIVAECKIDAATTIANNSMNYSKTATQKADEAISTSKYALNKH